MPLPPEGNALSAELRGSILDANTAQRPIQAPGKMRQGLLFLVLALCACQSLAPPNLGATLRARERDILDEATAIARAAAADLQRAEATVVHEATGIASMQHENAALLVTVRAGDAPPARRQGTGIGQRPPLTPGSRWFEKTGVSRFINPADGCVVSPQINFANDISLLYVTVRAWNVAAGLRLSVQWWHEGDPVHNEGFTLARAWKERCFRFWLPPDMVPFAPGSWSVQLYADGAPLETPQAFTLREAAMMMDG